MKTVLWLSILALAAMAQQNICYANCKEGYCDPLVASKCTNCDPGFIILNNRCIGGNTQSKPIIFLKPNSRNTFDQPNKNAISCIITNTAIKINTSMIFLPAAGRTFTQSFDITEPHSYLQIKLNAILAAKNRAPSNPSLLFSLYDSTGNSISGLLYSFNTNINPVQCTEGFLAQNVFFLNQKLSSSLNYIIIELQNQGSTDATIAVTDISLYYGNCSIQCKQCTGPLNGQCSSCNGFLTTLTKGRCSNCPTGFYENVICLECPVECEQCKLVNNEIKCTACNSKIAGIDTRSVYGCKSNFSQLINFKELNQNETDWRSTELSGNILTKCQSYSIIAGISIGKAGSSIFKTQTNLQSHTVIHLSFTLILIDQIGDMTAYQIQMDDEIIVVNVLMTPETGQQFTNECGNSGFQFLSRQSFSFNHTRDSVNIRINFLKDYAGIRNIALVFNNQTNIRNCYTESRGFCISCRNGLLLVNNTCNSCAEGYYFSNNSCVVCPINCRTCREQLGKAVCLTCNNPLVYQDKLCIDNTGSFFAADVFDNLQSRRGNNNWKFYPNLQNRGIDYCGRHRILGSSVNKFNFITASNRITGIPAHTGIVAMFHFFQIDDYSLDDSVKFQLGSNQTVYSPSNVKMNICGNETADAIVPVYLIDNVHTGDTLDFQVRFARMTKFGINNFMVYLLRNENSGPEPFEMTSIPTYSISTPPVKGLTVKLLFPQQFQNIQNINDAIEFRIAQPDQNNISASTNSSNSSNLPLNITALNASGLRALQQANNPLLQVQNSTINSNKQIVYLLNLNRDYTNENIQARISNLSNLYFIDANNNRRFFSQRKVVTTMPRYLDMDVNDFSNRSNTKNLYNLFRGLAILALFIGLASFLFGLSTAFDDFFFLCQFIFVHIFIQLDYNPPSIRIPFEGLSIVQFLSWFPWQGRQGIESGIIPHSLYQYSPLVYQQYYKDIVFARTIYQTVLFLIVIAIFWIVLKIILIIWDSKDLKTKYTNYILYYYNNYNSRKISFVDKVVRFIYFTVVWACILQFIRLSNEPKSFNIWNSVLTIIFFIFALAYPLLMFFLLRKYSDTMTNETFNKLFQDLRITSETLYYYLFQYYKKVVIACIIALLYNSSPIIPLIVLIVINLIDALILFFKRPLELNQPQLINASIFYPKYPKMYLYTMIIQRSLLIVLEILFLILYGQRDKSSRQAYMGIGYAICAFAILLLLNGVIRLFWGFMKLCEQIYLERQSFQLSVEKKVHENKDPAEEHPIMQQILKTEVGMSKFDLNPRRQNKNTSFVSKLRG